jgi:transcriptional regulator with XRE-family HTH domain
MAGLPARQLDALAGLATNHVANIESERLSDDVQSSTARKLCGVLGVSLDWLISGEGPEPKAKHVRAAVEKARAGKAA